MADEFLKAETVKGRPKNKGYHDLARRTTFGRRMENGSHKQNLFEIHFLFAEALENDDGRMLSCHWRSQLLYHE